MFVVLRLRTVLIAQNADGHSRARDGWKLDSSRETLVTLGIIILQADLKLNSLEKVALLGFGGVLKEFLNVRADAGD